MSRRRKRPATAMVLSAGLGLRMRPITETRPKPLVKVAGRTLIDRILDRLYAADVRRAVVNLHHLGGLLERHLDMRDAPEIVFSREPELLETGGGVKHALPLLGREPFYVLNGDVLWLDGRVGALERLAAAWNGRRMDVLLLLHQTAFAYGYQGPGDFMMDPLGRVRRRREREVAPFVFAGIQLLHPRLLEDAPDGPFSLNVTYDAAIERGRLYGLCHDGEWFHVGTPEDLKLAEDKMHYLSTPAAHR